MKHSIPAALALAVAVLSATPASAQRYRNTNISTPYGTFSHNEMQAAGNDPLMAMQNRQMQQQVQMQQQMMKQQQQFDKQQKQQADFLKKNPDAAKAIINAYTPKSAPKKMTRADREKAKRESGEVARTTPADPAATPKADPPKADGADTKPASPATSTTAKSGAAKSRIPQ